MNPNKIIWGLNFVNVIKRGSYFCSALYTIALSGLASVISVCFKLIHCGCWATKTTRKWLLRVETMCGVTLYSEICLLRPPNGVLLRLLEMSSRRQKLLTRVNRYLQSQLNTLLNNKSQEIIFIIEVVVTDMFHCIALSKLPVITI